MIEYIPYILLFALATAIIYGWGLWRAKRGYTSLPGGACDIGQCRRWEDLPKAAQD